MRLFIYRLTRVVLIFSLVWSPSLSADWKSPFTSSVTSDFLCRDRFQSEAIPARASCYFHPINIAAVRLASLANKTLSLPSVPDRVPAISPSLVFIPALHADAGSVVITVVATVSMLFILSRIFPKFIARIFNVRVEENDASAVPERPSESVLQKPPFTGTYGIKLDNRWRFKLHGNTAAATNQGPIIMEWDETRRIIKVVSKDSWLAAHHREGIVRTQETLRAFGSSVEQTMDASDRYLIPTTLRRISGIKPDDTIFLLGCNDHFELWPESEYEAYETGMRTRPPILLSGEHQTETPFLGQSTISVDPRGRIQLHKNIARQLPERDAVPTNKSKGPDKKVVIQLDIKQNIARVYPHSTWVDYVVATRPKDPAQAEEFDRFIYGTSYRTVIEADGRMQLPGDVRDAIGIQPKSRVCINGRDEYFEITPIPPPLEKHGGQPQSIHKLMIGWLSWLVEKIALIVFWLSSVVNFEPETPVKSQARDWTDANIERIEEAVFRVAGQALLMWLGHHDAPGGVPGLISWPVIWFLANAAQSLFFAFLHFGKGWGAGFKNRTKAGFYLEFLWVVYPFVVAYRLWRYFQWGVLDLPGTKDLSGWRRFALLFTSRAVGLHQLNNHWLDIGRDFNRIPELSPKDQSLFKRLSPSEQDLIGQHYWGSKDNGDARLSTPKGPLVPPGAFDEYRRAARRFAVEFRERLRTTLPPGETVTDALMQDYLDTFYANILQRSMDEDLHSVRRSLLSETDDIARTGRAKVSKDEVRKIEFILDIFNSDELILKPLAARRNKLSFVFVFIYEVLGLELPISAEVSGVPQPYESAPLEHLSHTLSSLTGRLRNSANNIVEQDVRAIEEGIRQVVRQPDPSLLTFPAELRSALEDILMNQASASGIRTASALGPEDVQSRALLLEKVAHFQWIIDMLAVFNRSPLFIEALKTLPAVHPAEEHSTININTQYARMILQEAIVTKQKRFEWSSKWEAPLRRERLTINPTILAELRSEINERFPKARKAERQRLKSIIDKINSDLEGELPEKLVLPMGPRAVGKDPGLTPPKAGQFMAVGVPAVNITPLHKAILTAFVKQPYLMAGIFFVLIGASVVAVHFALREIKSSASPRDRWIRSPFWVPSTLTLFFEGFVNLITTVLFPIIWLLSFRQIGYSRLIAVLNNAIVGLEGRHIAERNEARRGRRLAEAKALIQEASRLESEGTPLPFKKTRILRTLLQNIVSDSDLKDNVRRQAEEDLVRYIGDLPSILDYEELSTLEFEDPAFVTSKVTHWVSSQYQVHGDEWLWLLSIVLQQEQQRNLVLPGAPAGLSSIVAAELLIQIQVQLDGWSPDAAPTIERNRQMQHLALVLDEAPAAIELSESNDQTLTASIAGRVESYTSDQLVLTLKSLSHHAVLAPPPISPTRLVTKEDRRLWVLDSDKLAVLPDGDSAKAVYRPLEREGRIERYEEWGFHGGLQLILGLVGWQCTPLVDMGWWGVLGAILISTILQAAISSTAHREFISGAAWINRFLGGLYLGLHWWLAPMLAPRAFRMHLINNRIVDLKGDIDRLDDEDLDFYEDLFKFEKWLIGHYYWDVARSHLDDIWNRVVEETRKLGPEGEKPSSSTISVDPPAVITEVPATGGQPASTPASSADPQATADHVIPPVVAVKPPPPPRAVPVVEARFKIMDNRGYIGDITAIGPSESGERVEIRVSFRDPKRTTAGVIPRVYDLKSFVDGEVAGLTIINPDQLKPTIRRILRKEGHPERNWPKSLKKPFDEWLQPPRQQTAAVAPASPEAVKTLMVKDLPLPNRMFRALTAFGIGSLDVLLRLSTRHVKAAVGEKIPLAPLTDLLLKLHHPLALDLSVPGLSDLKLSKQEEAWLLVNNVDNLEALKRWLRGPGNNRIGNRIGGHVMLSGLHDKVSKDLRNQLIVIQPILGDALYQSLAGLQDVPRSDIDLIARPVLNGKRVILVVRLFNAKNELLYSLILSPLADGRQYLWATYQRQGAILPTQLTQFAEAVKQDRRSRRTGTVRLEATGIADENYIESEDVLAAWDYVDQIQLHKKPSAAHEYVLARHPLVQLGKLQKALRLLNFEALPVPKSPQASVRGRGDIRKFTLPRDRTRPNRTPISRRAH